MRLDLFIPTRGEVWYETANIISEAMVEASADSIVEIRVIYARSKVGVVEARNWAARAFLDGDASHMMMLDDDVVPQRGSDLIDLYADAREYDWDVLAAPCPIVRPGSIVLPNVYRIDEQQNAIVDLETVNDNRGMVEVGAVGFGLVCISRRCMAKIKYFKPRYTKERDWQMGEDVDFCLRARSQGFKVGAQLDLACEHMLTVHGNALAWGYHSLMEQVSGPEPQDGDRPDSPSLHVGLNHEAEGDEPAEATSAHSSESGPSGPGGTP